ncbi:phage tail protein [Roseinatronobacter sp.]|uniref:phage tail protein n=1 Tax=Roseinatronobacter sp. TaxID=1945755 RepID=UPI0025D45B8D|nr:phage tail protein [Roseibaca sp.]
MANLNDTGDQFPDVYQLEQTDPLLAGEPNEATGAGIDNIPHLQLARRTRWLKSRVDTLLASVVAGTTSVAGILRLNDSLTSDSVTEAATPNAIRRVQLNANTRVPATRTITGGGLATGGGALDQNRVLTVPKATDQQARDGVADDVALTPLTGRALVEEQLGGQDATGLVPSGALMDFAMVQAPAGWLVCDGSEVSRSEFASLFTAIGTVWGAGNGTTTFNLPDLRGEFRRGADLGRGVDAGRAFGSAQADAFKSHDHDASSASAGAHTHSGTAQSAGAHNHQSGIADTYEGFFGNGPEDNPPKIDNANTNNSGTTQSPLTSTDGAHSHDLTITSAGAHSHSVTVSARGGNETRPRNVSVLTCIKI